MRHLDNWPGLQIITFHLKCHDYDPEIHVGFGFIYIIHILLIFYLYWRNGEKRGEICACLHIDEHRLSFSVLGIRVCTKCFTKVRYEVDSIYDIPEPGLSH